MVKLDILFDGKFGKGDDTLIRVRYVLKSQKQGHRDYLKANLILFKESFNASTGIQPRCTSGFIGLKHVTVPKKMISGAT